MDINDLNGSVTLPMQDFLRLLDKKEKLDEEIHGKYRQIETRVLSKIETILVDINDTAHLLNMIIDSKFDLDDYKDEENRIIKIGRIVGDILLQDNTTVSLILPDDKKITLGAQNSLGRNIKINLNYG